ncbi:MAG: HTH domain-containing protein [Lachnospiraceae bacterium]|nr:HTH domain-containing protein [Lachnospiraceae bacterium]
MTEEIILKMLKDAKGEYVSGQAMAECLGISRAAIKKRIEALKKQGYLIDSVTRKGHRLLTAPDILTKAEIISHFPEEVVKELDIRCFESLSSTNTELKKLAIDGAGEFTCVVANEQTGGRGRNGKGFSSPKDTGLYISILLKPEITAKEAASYPALVANAVAKTVNAHLPESFKEKAEVVPPDDITLLGVKISGILIESAFETETGKLQYLVCGIGVHCNDEKDSIYSLTGKKVNRALLAADIITACCGFSHA